jgi:TRAP transporter 4TM/12TM fusion protein
VFQGLLAAIVAAWVLDLPRKLLDASFYTEQMLTAVLGLALAITYLQANRGRPGWLDQLAAALSLALCGYIAARYPTLSNELTMLPVDGMIGSAILLVLVLEATRRLAGPTLVIIVLAMIAYVFIGPHMPGEFQTRPVRPERLIVYLGLDINALISSLLGVAIIIVVPFTIMGQVLSRTGGSDFFADLAMSAMGAFRGGAAKIAVVGSALFGMISGAAVSNVMAVGIVTIPLMIRSGFAAKRAAAIEAVGSTGGQLMPPVMGAAAFIMAELLQTSYSAVVLAAIVPSLLYYGTLFACVDLEAAREKIGAAKSEEDPKFLEVLRDGWHFLLPIGFLIVGLMYLEMQAERAAIYSALMLLALNFVFTYRGKRCTLRELGRAVLETGRASLDIILIGAAAGLVVGVLNISGLAFGLTLQLVTLSGESVLLLLLLTALLSFVLGMGMPTVGVYVLTATLIAPALVQLGVKPMAAHMFVMYYGMLSMITPPVALAAFAAANIARVSGWQAGWASVAFGWSAFVLPFLFVGRPTLLLDGAPLDIVLDILRTSIGIYLGCVAVVGYSVRPLGAAARGVYALAAVTVLLVVYVLPDSVGLELAMIALGGGLLAADHVTTRKGRAAAPA